MHQYCINPWSVLFGGLHMTAIYLENGFALSPKSYYNDIVQATSAPFAVITSASVFCTNNRRTDIARFFASHRPN
jgi:hypothetical protein